MAAYLQNSAQGNQYFKTACVTMATHYHMLEQRIINRFYDKDEKNVFIPRLNEDKAVKLGATIIGEAFIFGVAASALVMEYRRSTLKEAAKEKQMQERLMMLEAQILQLQSENDRVLKRIFPDEQHIRSSIDVNYESEGWVSWLTSYVRQLSQSGEERK
ncbi:optic atrophy 3 protein [Cyclospora cayetanensis]|nr:optic atrophy 3 protein [Cyclospora cayetanensis]